MMKILYTSDIHASPEHLYSMLLAAEKERVDCIIIGGDIVPHYLPDTRTMGVLKAQEVYLENIFIPALKNFKKRLDASIYLDLGNDDFVANRHILKSHENNLLYLLHMRKHKLIDGVDIIGYMNVPPTPFTRKDWEKPDSAKMPFAKGNQVSLDGYSSKSGDLEKTFIDLESHDTIEKDLLKLSQLINGPFIFVSHSPPYLTDLDILDNGLHVGSVSIKQFIKKWSEKNQLIVSLHGHIHGSADRSGSISSHIGGAMCINPGQNEGAGSSLRYVILELTDWQTSPKVRIIFAPKH